MNTIESSKRYENNSLLYGSNKKPIYPKSAYRSAHAITVHSKPTDIQTEHQETFPSTTLLQTGKLDRVQSYAG